MADEEQRARYLEHAERFQTPRLAAWRRYLALREGQRAARDEAQKMIIDLQIEEILAEIDALHRMETENGFGCVALNSVCLLPPSVFCASHRPKQLKIIFK
jgi:hypothetical protein